MSALARMMRRTTWSWVTLGVVVLTAGLLALAPMAHGTSCETVSFGSTTCSTTSESLLESDGADVLVALAVPIGLALVPLVVGTKGAARVAAIGLTAFAVVAGFSIGMFFLPAALIAWAGAAAPQPSPRARIRP